MLVGLRGIPVRNNVEPDPTVQGIERVVEHPEEYKNFLETANIRKSSVCDQF
jgi:hypothetical protein